MQVPDVSAALLILTYCIAPFTVATVAADKLGDESEKNHLAIFLSCLGLGPLAIAWSLEMLLRIAPGLSNEFYILSIVIILLFTSIAAIFSRSVLREIWHQTIIQWKIPRRDAVIATFFLLGAAWNFFSAFRISLRSYFTGNDALEYGRMAQLIYEHKNLSIYPFFADNGIQEYFGSAHPLAYHLSIAWSFLINGSAEFFGHARFINPFFAVCTAAILWGAFSGRKIIYGALAVFFLSMSPTYMDLIWNKHIDIIRTYGYCLAIFGTCLFIAKKSYRNAVLLGVGIGASLFTHALGILTPLIVGAVLVVQTRPVALLRSWRFLALAGFIAIMVGGNQYVRNTIKFGTPTSNTTPVWDLDSVRYEESVAVLRNLQTTEQKIVNGLFGPFTKPDMYSYIFWMLPLGLLLLALRQLDDTWSRICLLATGVFFALMGLSMVMGSITLIMNGRYVLGLQPLVASVAAFCLGKYYERKVSVA